MSQPPTCMFHDTMTKEATMPRTTPSRGRPMTTLFAAQVCGSTGHSIGMAIGGITAAAITGTNTWSGIPIAVGALGTALASWPLSRLMERWGRRPGLAGVFLGLGTAAKLYPLLFFIPLLALCWRAGQLRAFWRAAAGAVLAWAVVDVPVALLWPDSWLQFLKLNRERSADFDSLWYGFHQLAGSGLWLLKLVLDRSQSDDPEKFRAAVMSLDLPVGTMINGWGVKFSETGQNANERVQHYMLQWQNGQLVTVWPEEFTTNRAKWIPLGAWDQRK